MITRKELLVRKRELRQILDFIQIKEKNAIGDEKKKIRLQTLDIKGRLNEIDKWLGGEE